MAFSIFIDALPYTELKENYNEWMENQEIAELQPNIAYSSSLHWQLYCNKYPDERKVLVDWALESETNKMICFISSILRPLDTLGNTGAYARKILDRCFFKKNIFANIPFKFRKYFSNQATYLFWDNDTYSKEKIFSNYKVISEDEEHKGFNKTFDMMMQCIDSGEKNIFASYGFADKLGHMYGRTEIYQNEIKGYMNKIKKAIESYLRKHPNEEVIIMSDHGMSTVKRRIDLGLEKKFGKQSKGSYIAYSDSCVMCIWCQDKHIKDELKNYLKTKDCGHLLNESERKYYGVTNKKFGDYIYILNEGNVFDKNWFGISIKKNKEKSWGMHGFWPQRSSRDQMGSIILINGKEKLKSFYTYPEACKLINSVMEG